MLHDVESVVDGKLMVRRGEVELSGSGKIKGGEILGEGRRGREGGRTGTILGGVGGRRGPAGWVGGRKREERAILHCEEGGLTCAKHTDLCKMRG
jgi:hypothetical protein